MPLKLFTELLVGGLFYFGDKTSRLLIKTDRSHYISPEGRRSIHPHVAVFEHKAKTDIGGETIYEKFMKGKEK